MDRDGKNWDTLYFWPSINALIKPAVNAKKTIR
jgi:hypothetical protein